MFRALDFSLPHSAQILRKYFDTWHPANVLEIASGHGYHISYFALHFPNITFQPSEKNVYLFDYINECARDTPTKNVKDAIEIDVTTDPVNWNLNLLYDYIININMFEKTPMECAVGLFKNGSKVLKNKGLIFTYGRYAKNGVITPESNVKYHKSLKDQDVEWGLRDIVELEEVAKRYDINLLHIYDMPYNNKCLVWIKENFFIRKPNRYLR